MVQDRQTSIAGSWNSYPLDLIFGGGRFVFQICHPGLSPSKPPGLMMTTMPGPLRETLSSSAEHAVSMAADPQSTTKGQGHGSGGKEATSGGYEEQATPVGNWGSLQLGNNRRHMTERSQSCPSGSEDVRIYIQQLSSISA